MHCQLCSWVKSLTRSKAVNDQLTYLLFYIDIHRINDRYKKFVQVNEHKWKERKKKKKNNTSEQRELE